MNKILIIFLSFCIFASFILTACSLNQSGSDSIISESSLLQEETKSDESERLGEGLSTNSQEEDAVQSSLSEDIYIQAMDKWNTLGGNFDFKNVESIDTGTLVSIYSSYMMQSGKLNFDTPDVWMELAGFDEFVENYFDLTPEQYHQNYPGASDNYDIEKGFLFYRNASILPDNTKYQMINHGDNGDGTYYFEVLATWELPKELLPEGESNVVERTTTVTFKYADSVIHFVGASYQQNGEDL